MTKEDYMKTRVEDQIKWYGEKSARNKKLHLWSNSMVIICAALIPFASGFMQKETTWLNYLIAGLGMLTAVLTGISALYKYQDKWSEYRTTCESLKHEKIMYETKSGPYENSKDDFRELVRRVENLISKENSNWSQYIGQ